MLNKHLRFSSNQGIDYLIKIGLCTLLLTMGGSVIIRKDLNVPITLQSLLVLLPAIWFGWRVGLITVILYILAGGFGLPVFAGGSSGWEKIINPVSGGFFWGFVLSAIITGYIAERIKPQEQLKNIGLWFFGHIIILGSGLLWIMQIREDYWLIVEETAPGLALKSAVGYFFSQLIFRVLVSRESYYQK